MSYPWADEVYTVKGTEYRNFFGDPMDILTELKKRAESYAAQRDDQAAEANRLYQSAENHRRTSFELAGAYTATIALIEHLTPPAGAMPGNSSAGQIGREG